MNTLNVNEQQTESTESMIEFLLIDNGHIHAKFTFRLTVGN